MDNEPTWPHRWRRFLESSERMRRPGHGMDSWVNYAAFLERRLLTIQRGFLQQADNIFTNHILGTGIRSNDDLEREKPKTSTEFWTERKLLQYISAFMPMQEWFWQYQTLIWAQLDAKIKIGLFDSSLNATEDIHILEKESAKNIAFMEKWRAIVYDLMKTGPPSTYQMQFDHLNLWRDHLQARLADLP
ncbi:hypothetical protein GX51_05803 [Blastomyces parvus]|uniref:Uncharacterized protein n=1 Tax=Blastomyces parvus TaxID=2060905 RepID=A0A2B7WUQ2_9EURO|nr:hypothetical protein GX51_05803 [Blastomyces parvus]